MKNDLIPIEKNLLKLLNLLNGTQYTHKNFMEWSSSRTQVESNLEKGEIVYEVSGLYVAIKPNVIPTNPKGD